MNLERTLKAKIRKYTDKIQSLESDRAEIEKRLIETRAYLQALEDTMKHVSRGEPGSGDTARVRLGGVVDKTIKTLTAANAPMHVGKILEALGNESTSQTRKALSAQLNTYVRSTRIFKRTAPNTFGLIEWSTSAKGGDSEGGDPPEDPHSPPRDFEQLRSVN